MAKKKTSKKNNDTINNEVTTEEVVVSEEKASENTAVEENKSVEEIAENITSDIVASEEVKADEVNTVNEEVKETPKAKKAKAKETVKEIKETVKDDIKETVKEENKEVKTVDLAAAANNSVFTSNDFVNSDKKPIMSALLGAGAKDVTSADDLAEKVAAMPASDAKILAELLLELKKDQEAESAYAKRHMVFSIVTSIISLTLVVICMGILFPQITGLVNNLNIVLNNTNKIVVEAEEIMGEAEEIVGRADVLFDQTEFVVKNLQKTTDELAATDFDGMMKDVSELVDSTQGTLDEALGKITSIDIDTLNSSIKGLNDVVEPLSKLFGGGSNSSSESTTKKKGLFW